MAYQGITYKTDKEVIKGGPMEASTETTKRIPLPPVLGGLALAGGTILVLVGARKV